MSPRQQEENCLVTKSLDQTGQKKKNSSPLVFFRVGPFRFGIHGVAGLLSFIFVTYGLILSKQKQQLNGISIVIVISTLISSIGSYSLLSQVPNTSHISSWIIPPHREAFKRTIAIIVYLNLRLVHLWQWNFQGMSINGNDANIILHDRSLIFPVLLLVYTNYNFFPLHLDYTNGNTWVFVVPMFLAINIDAIYQFPSIVSSKDEVLTLWRQCNNDEMNNSIVNKMYVLHEFIAQHSDWNHVHDWNQNKVNETYLLLTLFCALQIAFMFTIAFRGKMSIKSCYWIAAIEVALLCIRLIHNNKE